MKNKKFLEILISTLLGLGLVTYTKDPFLSIFIYICLVAVYKLIRALVFLQIKLRDSWGSLFIWLNLINIF